IRNRQTRPPKASSDHTKFMIIAGHGVIYPSGPIPAAAEPAAHHEHKINNSGSSEMLCSCNFQNA
uniref:hypothetical protein n=1 Tax=Nocardia farcinica TaxID=37329 RepID=UPI0034DB58D8